MLPHSKDDHEGVGGARGGGGGEGGGEDNDEDEDDDDDELLDAVALWKKDLVKIEFENGNLHSMKRGNVLFCDILMRHSRLFKQMVNILNILLLNSAVGTFLNYFILNIYNSTCGRFYLHLLGTH
ncbi:hypothetical protein EGR_10180 [Echinococcus granulosus]|uniref:Uncharacterized protein n=1 Tax=Echinococcus granulosus TaxID=6210 RepID=W6U908_ECHGR|nr:hypothetical protein EGR_10180 [Echinococcus granulosus]EUB54972.1 hypothetical protein EGR_10180 [Echinococcus granulosus]